VRRSVNRIEVFLDGEREPLRTLARPPFKLQLDTRLLPRGSHLLRIESVFSDGEREVRRVRFDADKVPLIVFEGLATEAPDPARLSGRHPWALLAIALAIGLAAIGLGARERTSVPTPASAPVPSAGRIAFERACARCHGAEPGEPLASAAARVDAARFEPWARDHLRAHGYGATQISSNELQALFELLQRPASAPAKDR
jgi:mono/diheme cytochrome c family protein